MAAGKGTELSQDKKSKVSVGPARGEVWGYLGGTKLPRSQIQCRSARHQGSCSRITGVKLFLPVAPLLHPMEGQTKSGHRTDRVSGSRCSAPRVSSPLPLLGARPPYVLSCCSECIVGFSTGCFSSPTFHQIFTFHSPRSVLFLHDSPP